MKPDLEILQVSSQLWVSELYGQDAPDSVLLAEYPSSNSDQTRFRNDSEFIIHDPYPPPRPELLKCLGPHHLMFGWGNQLAVTSQVEPPERLLQHWSELLGPKAIPIWRDFDSLPPGQDFVVLFPHQTLAPNQQLIEPVVNYQLHSKKVIERIDCSQAKILETPQFPCIAKLTHGYAGLGNFVLENEQSLQAMNSEVSSHWPGCELVFNAIIENIRGDYGVQFYLRRDGAVVWLGFTEQKFDVDGRWCGGWFSSIKQHQLVPKVEDIVLASAKYLSSQGYFGVVGIDILEDSDDRHYLVDVNPRLTGVTPFLMASRQFAEEGFQAGIYRASCRYQGTLNDLLGFAESISNAKLAVLSAYEDRLVQETICHLSVSASDHQECIAIFDRWLKSE